MVGMDDPASPETVLGVGVFDAMIGLTAGARIWIVAGVTDMRRGSVGLAAMVQTALHESPFSGGSREAVSSLVGDHFTALL